MAIDPEKIEALLEADVANIVRKIGSGATLTQVERKRLEEARSAKSGGGEGDGGAVNLEGMSIAGLAEHYGVSVSTIKRDRKRGLPVRDPEAYRAAKADQQKRPESMSSDAPAAGDGGETKEELQKRKLRLECDRLAFWIEVERGEYIPIARVREDMLKIAGATQGAVVKLESDLPPKVQGLAAAGIQKVVRAAAQKLLEDLSNKMSVLYSDPRPAAGGAGRKPAKKKAARRTRKVSKA